MARNYFAELMWIGGSMAKLYDTPIKAIRKTDVDNWLKG